MHTTRTLAKYAQKSRTRKRRHNKNRRSRTDKRLLFAVWPDWPLSTFAFQVESLLPLLLLHSFGPLSAAGLPVVASVISFVTGTKKS